MQNDICNQDVMTGLFQHTILKKYLKGAEDKTSLLYRQYTSYFHHPEIQENIRNSKEEQFQFKRLTDNLGSLKITGALERFDELEFKQFMVELKKQKITLSLKQQDEWAEYFSEYMKECNSLVSLINTTDREIDGMVYELHGLTEEEMGMVEK